MKALALLLLAAACPPLAAQQSCDANASALTLPASRFEDHGDGTISDKSSGLMWLRCASGQQWQGGRCTGTAAALSRAEATRFADSFNREGSAFFNDWRVPSLRELATITERRCANPRTNLTVFPNTPAEPFWSSTPRMADAAGGRLFWALSFGTEGLRAAPAEERLHVRLVRTGP